MLGHVGLRHADALEQLPHILLTLAQLADDAQTDRRRQYSKQLNRFVESLINLIACARLAI